MTAMAGKDLLFLYSRSSVQNSISMFIRNFSGDENEDLLRAMKFSKAKKRKAL